MNLDLERVRSNVQAATTEDLLDRVTVYRAGMEPEALQIVEEELVSRSVSAAEIADHEERRRKETTLLPDGTAVRCTLCHRPAVAEGWDWHRLWGLIPIFPRFFHYCAEHVPDSRTETKPHDEVTSG
jgi:hypothetical protein